MVEEPLPFWAKEKSDGTYLQAGAQLCTRDGRRCGNSVVKQVLLSDVLGHIALIETDKGTRFRMTEEELKELFYPPKYIMRDLD